MELIKKEIIIKETKTLFVLVGESIDNNKFLSKCIIKNDLIVVNIDNKKMSDFSKEPPLFSKTQKTVPARSKLFAGVLRALRAICRPMCATRFGDRILQPSLLLHGIGTGPSNRAPFQSTGPRPDIIKLEDHTASRTASLD
jgi:hypothetical protein